MTAGHTDQVVWKRCRRHYVAEWDIRRYGCLAFCSKVLSSLQLLNSLGLMMPLYRISRRLSPWAAIPALTQEQSTRNLVARSSCSGNRTRKHNKILMPLSANLAHNSGRPGWYAIPNHSLPPCISLGREQASFDELLSLYLQQASVHSEDVRLTSPVCIHINAASFRRRFHSYMVCN